MPIRARLALTVLAAASLLVFVGVWYFDRQLQEGMRDTVDETLEARAAPLVALLLEARVPVDREDLRRRVATSPTTLAMVVDPDGVVVASSLGDDAALVRLERLGALDQRRFFEVEIDAVTALEETRILTVPVDRANGTWAVIVGTSTEISERAASDVHYGLVMGGVLAVVGITVGAWFLAGKALAPVERMRQEVAAITALDGDRELARRGHHNELSRLAATFNDLLARLRLSLRRERRFVADASHELRTPLAVLRTELELAARPGRTREELHNAVRDAHDEAVRLGRVADDLLLMARSHDGVALVRSRPHDLATVLDRALSAFGEPASRVDVDLRADFARPLPVEADPDRLRQAVDNLLDNALRHARDGRVVTLAARCGGGVLTISASDNGPGFPSEFLPHAFEAFERADSARTRGGSGGAGLGLAIVDAIARAHGGIVVATNRPEGGARVTLTLPQPQPSVL